MKIAPLVAKGWLYFWHAQGVEWLGNKSKAATVSQVHVFKFCEKWWWKFRVFIFELAIKNGYSKPNMTIPDFQEIIEIMFSQCLNGVLLSLCVLQTFDATTASSYRKTGVDKSKLYIALQNPPRPLHLPIPKLALANQNSAWFFRPHYGICMFFPCLH